MTTQQETTQCAQSNDHLRCKIAETRQERSAAFRLIYNSYLQSSLAKPNRFEMRVYPHHLLSTTQVFVALAYGPETPGEVVETVSLMEDGDFGLPMEAVYGHLVTTKRRQGIAIGEVSCLADRRRDFRRFFTTFFELVRPMFQFARKRGLEQLLAAVHPKHARFYTRYMGFQQVGELTSYPNACHQPAVPLCFDFARNDREGFKYYDRIFAEPLPDSDLQPQSMSQREIDDLRVVAEQSYQLEMPRRFPSLAVDDVDLGRRCAII